MLQLIEVMDMLNHKGTITLTTERIKLRRFSDSDAEDMFNNWANDTDVCRFLHWAPHGTIETTKNIVHNWVGNYKNENFYNWVIEYNGHAIGNISVVDSSDKYMSCEIGYCMGKAYWGQGIMTEALRAVIAHLFIEVGFNRIMAKHDTENIGSGRVMQKSGMSLEGTMRQARIRKDGTFGNLNIYSVLKDEWEKTDKWA